MKILPQRAHRRYPLCQANAAVLDWNTTEHRDPGLIFPGDSAYTGGKYRNGPVRAGSIRASGLPGTCQCNGRMTIRAACGMFGDHGGMIRCATILFDAPVKQLSQLVLNLHKSE